MRPSLAPAKGPRSGAATMPYSARNCKPCNESSAGRSDDGEAAHMGLQRGRDIDAAIGALIVLQHRDQRATEREPGAIERTHELRLALRKAANRLHALRLELL